MNNEQQRVKMSHYYRSQRSCGKVVFLHVSVILFTGGCLGRHPLRSRHPPGRHPTWADTPQEQTAPRQTPPPGQTPPGQKPPCADNPLEQTPPPGADTPSGADISPQSIHPSRSRPPHAMHAGRYGQQAGSTHPTGIQSCLW